MWDQRGTARTRNAPPLLKIDLGRVSDVLPTLLSEEALKTGDYDERKPLTRV